MPSQIAQIIVPDDGGGQPWNIIHDWDRGRMYFLNNLCMRIYRIALETQTPLLTVFAFDSYMVTSTTDPVTGHVLTMRPAPGASITNAMPIYKLDPNTLEIVDSFGGSTSYPNWPDSEWLVEFLICVGCGTLASGGAEPDRRHRWRQALCTGSP